MAALSRAPTVQDEERVQGEGGRGERVNRERGRG